MRMTNKLHLHLTVVLILVLVSGFGCRGLSQEQLAAVQPVNLEYWTVFNDVALLQQFVNEYRQQNHSYININIRQVRVEEFDRLFVNALADEVAPDIVSLHARWLRQYQNRLLAMPPSVRVASVFIKGKYQPETVVTVSNNLMPTRNSIKRDFITTVGDDVINGESVYGLPLAADTLALYYNKELLDKAGVPVPPATWTEFTEAVKKATRYDRDGNIIQSGVAMGTGNNIDNAADILIALMAQNGVTVARGGVVSFANGLDRSNPAHPALEAMRFYTDFAQPTKDVYAWNAKMNNALEEFARGKSVFYVGYAYDRPRIQARGPQLEIEAVPLPQLNPAVPGNVANYWVEAVVKKTKNPNEAWDFIRFMTTAENIKRYTEATGQPSPLRAQIAAQQDNPNLAPFAAQILYAQNWYRGADYNAAKLAFTDLLASYLEPYGENQDSTERDANLIGRAQQVVQQTY